MEEKKNEKTLYNEMLEIFKNKNYDVKDFVETLEVNTLEKKLEDAIVELKLKLENGRINASNYKNKINRMLEIATEKLPKKRTKKVSNQNDETSPATENKETKNQ